jgi:hypothetical protein
LAAHIGSIPNFSLRKSFYSGVAAAAYDLSIGRILGRFEFP